MIHTIPQEKQEQIIRVIGVLFPNAKIYLFGSRAKKTNTEWSDIDIAIDAGEPIDFGKKCKTLNMLDALNIPQKIDFVDLHKAPEALKANILRDGVLWKN